jgi:BirA family biotin operon repressor/biotin-[acetyl-CoA-carboxylase] ligase
MAPFAEIAGAPAAMSPSCPTPDAIDPAALRVAGLATVEILAETGSTMERARELAADGGCPLPAIVIAERQTAGRGRRGAHWWQPPGSLAASLVLEAGTDGGPPPTWSLACGVALAETLREIEPAARACVRWPNDVEVEGRKLAGILVEAVAAGRVVFGIGVNTTGTAAAAPPALARRVATMPDLTGRSLPRGLLLASFVPRFRELLAAIAADPALLAARYRPLCGLAGRRVTIHVGSERHEGLCRGIAASGALELDTAAGPMQFVSGSLTDPADVWRGGG